MKNATIAQDAHDVARRQTIAAASFYDEAASRFRQLQATMPEGPEKARWLAVARHTLAAAERALVLAIHGWRADLEQIDSLIDDIEDGQATRWPVRAVAIEGRHYVALPSEGVNVGPTVVVLDQADVPAIGPR